MEPVERALDELYSADPAEFTKRRDALVKDLKKAGDKGGAARVASKRKPTQIAYILNQLARQHPDAVGELVDVGRELAREQRKALRGETAHGLRDSIDRQRKAVSEVGQKAAAVMKSLGLDPMAHLQEVTTALQAALIDPLVGAALEAGQLEKAPEAAVGFGGPIAPGSEPAVEPEADSEEPEPAPAPRAKKRSEPPERDEEAERKEKERARARAAHAESVAEAKAVLAAAAAEAERARVASEQASTESQAAELVFQKAREAANHASREAKRLAAELATAQRTVAAAEKELSRLEASAPE